MIRGRPVILALACAWLALSPAPGSARSVNEAIAKGRAAFQQYIADSSTPGVSVAVILGDELVWAEGFGLADVEHQVPVTPTTLFRAWSVAKPMTAAAAALLHERGRLDLDAPVRTYVPAFPDKGYPITTRQLGGHRSGLPHYGAEDLANHVPYGSVSEALDKFKDRPLLFEPGTAFAYSTFGYNLIGAIVESAAGVPFAEFMEAEIFRPLGMRHTRPDRHREIIPGRTSFYEITEDGEVTHAPFTDNSDLLPGGGFLSTPGDLAAFGAGLLRGALHGPETVAMLFTPMGPARGDREYAFGWFVLRRGEAANDRILMHSGSHYGGAALLTIWERRRMVMAIMANTSMSGTASRALPSLRDRVAEAFLAIPER